jgi:hypothetical protein
VEDNRRYFELHDESRPTMRCCIAIVASLVSAFAGGTTADAQPGLVIRPNRPNPNAVHEVTIVNGIGMPIRLRTVGFRRDASFTADFNVRESRTHRFFNGERVVTVWGRDRQLVFAAVVPFNRPGRLVIRDPGGRRSASPRAPAIVGRGGLPTLGIE